LHLESGMAASENIFHTLLDSIELSFETLSKCALITLERSHHPNFETAWKILQDNGDVDDPQQLLYYIFGEIALHNPKEIVKFPEWFASHNCTIEEALEALMETTEWRDSGWDRDKYDQMESAICLFCANQRPKRSDAELIQFLSNHFGDKINSYWKNKREAKTTLGTFFGYSDFFLQQGPREAALALHQERNIFAWPMKPFSDPADFPNHEDGRELATVYGGASDIRSHINEETGQKLVSKKIPIQLVRKINEDQTRDYPPSEVQTNLTLQDYFSLAPTLSEPCPFIVRHLGTTTDEIQKTSPKKRRPSRSKTAFFYWMEGGEDYHCWISSTIFSAKKRWLQHLKAHKEVKGLYKTEKSPWHKERTKDFIRIASAVKYMHEMKIYHRDIKLENLILVDGKVKLIDFGVSMRLSWSDKGIRARDLVGTPQYASPECLNVEGGGSLNIQQDDYDCEKNDVWCLGHILYSIIFGKNLYSECSIADPKFRYITEDSYLPKEQQVKSNTIKKFLKSDKTIMHATESLIDLFQNIFCPEDERLTMDEIFEHEWLEDELTEMKSELSFLKNCEFYDDIEDPV